MMLLGILYNLRSTQSTLLLYTQEPYSTSLLTKPLLSASRQHNAPTLTEPNPSLTITTPTLQHNLIVIIQVPETRAVFKLDRLSGVKRRLEETAELTFLLR